MKSQEFCCLLLRWRCQVFEVYVLTWTLIEKVGKKCGWKKKGFFYAHIQPTFIINLKWKIFLGDMSDLSLLKRESCCTVWKIKKYALTTKIRKTTFLLKKLKKRWFCEKHFHWEWISCFSTLYAQCFYFSIPCVCILSSFRSKHLSMMLCVEQNLYSASLKYDITEL